MPPLISYLLPSYNHASYLPCFLESLLSDLRILRLPAEVIIIDDGSRDNSAELIQNWFELNQNELKLTFIFQENKGIAACLNKMIHLAEGEFLRFCASDDVIKEGSTRRLYEEFLRDPRLRCVFADAEVIDEAGNLLNKSSIAFHGGRVKHLLNPKLAPKELIQHWCLAGPCHLIKKSHYDLMRYDEFSKIDDYPLFLSLLTIPNSLLFVNEAVCLYRIHLTNTSKTKNKQQRLVNLRSFLDTIIKYQNNSKLVNYLPFVKFYTKAKIYFLHKQYFRSILALILSLFFKIKSETWIWRR